MQRIFFLHYPHLKIDCTGAKLEGKSRRPLVVTFDVLFSFFGVRCKGLCSDKVENATLLSRFSIFINGSMTVVRTIEMFFLRFRSTWRAHKCFIIAGIALIRVSLSGDHWSSLEQAVFWNFPHDPRYQFEWNWVYFSGLYYWLSSPRSNSIFDWFSISSAPKSYCSQVHRGDLFFLLNNSVFLTLFQQSSWKNASCLRGKKNRILYLPFSLLFIAILQSARWRIQSTILGVGN